MRFIILLEEPSAKAFLERFLPRILPSVSLQFIVFRGKQDLLKEADRKIKYWIDNDAIFVILCDQDNDEKSFLIQEIQTICQKSNKPQTLIFLACRELESWFLGDLEATAAVLDKPALKKLQNKEDFRDPDRIVKPSQELGRLTENHYRKSEHPAALGAHLRLPAEVNRSLSFREFVQGMTDVAGRLIERPI